MFNEVILIHRSGSTAFDFAQPSEPSSHALGLVADHRSSVSSGHGAWLRFYTCMRKIVVGQAHHLSSVESLLKDEDEIYYGERAYQFLLQVICGLHSPLVGETEVYGQFKKVVSEFSIPASPWGLEMKRLIQSLFEDAKRIRQHHLKDLGSQSYGSILRRELKGFKQVHFLGAGQLVQEILPWLSKDGTQIHLHCRDVAKVSQEMMAFPHVRVSALDQKTNLELAEALIIAAPVSATWVESWLPECSVPQVIADLRGESAEDRICRSERVLNLADLFSRIESNQAQIMARKRAALAAIDAAVEERSRYVEYRPFGWDDVCA